MHEPGPAADARARRWQSEWEHTEPQDQTVRRRGRRGEDPRRQGKSFFAELPLLILIAFVLALVLKTFLVQAFYIPSGSMEPTLAVSDRVLVNKVVFDLREPRRGEVVVFAQEETTPTVQPSSGAIGRFFESLAAGLGLGRPNERDFIKRIIGLPGETVEVREGVVHIDGEPLPERLRTEGGYLSSLQYEDFGPVKVPEGHYFMMGDNRPNSSDSRYVGAVAEEDIIGRAFVIIWPPGRLGLLAPPDYAALDRGAADQGVPEESTTPAALSRTAS